MRQRLVYIVQKITLAIFSLSFFFFFFFQLAFQCVDSSANREPRLASDFDYREALIGFNETTGAIKVKIG